MYLYNSIDNLQTSLQGLVWIQLAFTNSKVVFTEQDQSSSYSIYCTCEVFITALLLLHGTGRCWYVDVDFPSLALQVL